MVITTEIQGLFYKTPPSFSHEQPVSDQETSTIHIISNFVSYKSFSTNHKAYLASISSNNDPTTFSQASQDERWCEALEKEIKALEENGTRKLTTFPEGKRAIDSK